MYRSTCMKAYIHIYTYTHILYKCIHIYIYINTYTHAHEQTAPDGGPPDYDVSVQHMPHP